MIKTQNIRIIEFPRCKMVSSGRGMFGQEKFERFGEWFSSQKAGIYPKDFLCGDENGFLWLYLYDKSLSVPDEFEIIDFFGGLYSVATDIDTRTDMAALKAEEDAFFGKNGLERDESRLPMGNIITSAAVREILGYSQMDYYTPVKKKGQK